jgi:hypothetical protein
MSADLLTRDNIHLSRPKSGDFDAAFEPANLSKPPVDQHVASLVRDSLADNTRRAYLSDLVHFERWGGLVTGHDTPEFVFENTDGGAIIASKYPGTVGARRTNSTRPR